MSRLYFEKFREALRDYADGVHQLGEPAPAERLSRLEAQLGAPVPPAYRDFLASWDGAELFHEDLRVFSADACVAEHRRARAEEGWPAERVLVAESAAGGRDAVLPRGAGVELEAGGRR